MTTLNIFSSNVAMVAKFIFKTQLTNLEKLTKMRACSVACMMSSICSAWYACTGICFKINSSIM